MDEERNGDIMIKKELRKAMLAALVLSMALGTAGCGNKEAGKESDGRAGVTEGDTKEKDDKSGTDAGKEDGPKPDANEGKENGQNSDANAGDKAGEGDTAVDGSRFRAAKDYQELLAAFAASETVLGSWAYYGIMTDGVAAADSKYSGAYDINTEEAVPGSSGVSDEKDYSDTNVQVEGIAEADIVKTDGGYIYVLSRCRGTKVFIIRADEGSLEFVSAIPLQENGQYGYGEQMYVSGNRLVIVRQGEKACQDEEPQYRLDWWRGYYTESQTEIMIYDITDRTAPKLAAAHTQDGWYVSSREKDGYLYVISEKSRQHYYYIQPIDIDAADAGADSQDETVGEDGLSERERAQLPQTDDALLLPEDIYFCGQNMDSAYTIVTAINLSEPEQIADSISLVAGSNHCYMCQNAIYLAAYDWSDYTEKNCNYTKLVRIAYEDGRLTLAAQGKVKGNLDDQFSMDERDGYLRIVTTVDYYEINQESDYQWWEYTGMSNSLYVLDADLNVVGALENLAENEMIYSARFIGDIAYFVTYRNTDPLFSVDVSDPENPVLLGALKIPGFSDYLHPFGDHLLLGIGYDAGDTDEATNYVKLTMFDITDPLNVVEKHTLILDGYSGSEACYNHKSALVDQERSLIGFPVEGYISSYEDDGFREYTEKKAYVVYGYDEEDGFYPKFEKAYVKSQSEKDNDIVGEDEWNLWYDMQLRGIYIGDYFYTISSTKEVVSWLMEQGRFIEGMALEVK